MKDHQQDVNDNDNYCFFKATKWEWKKIRAQTPLQGNPPCPRLGKIFIQNLSSIFLTPTIEYRSQFHISGR